MMPLDEVAIAERLDELLEVEFSFRDTTEPSRRIAPLAADAQQFVFDWAARVASTQAELGYQFACLAPAALDRLPREAVEAWAVAALDTYDRVGLVAALAELRDVEGFAQRQRERLYGAAYDEVGGVMLHFLQGLSGRRLKTALAERAYTDSEAVFLPPMVALFDTAEENFRLYKVTAAFLWAQVRFGSFNAPLVRRLLALPEAGRERFLACETLRLEGCLARELPGLHRSAVALLARAGVEPVPPAWRTLAERLGRPGTTAQESLDVLEQVARLPPLPPRPYQGELRLDAVAERLAARLPKEKARFRVALAELVEELRRKGRGDGVERFEQEPGEFDLDMNLTVDGVPLRLPEPLRDLGASITLDLGEIPEEYLTPAGPGEYDLNAFADKALDPDEVWRGTYHEEGAFLYPEWDYQRQHYRKRWCTLREVEMVPADPAFVAHTLVKYGPLVRQIRRGFEALRGEDRVLRRQPEGEEVDLDAVVEAHADATMGLEVDGHLFAHRRKVERNIATLFLVDMSGSTRGWINDAEREALVLLCEALESLGDRYAIAGFSGMTRKRCDLFVVKRFEDRYDARVKGRIAAIAPKDYTRMGPAIRHATTWLHAVAARTKLLVTLSDGKPDDLTDYRGEPGIADTRQALVEARREGVHPFCITIDEHGPEYLPRLYGPAAYTVIDDVRRLPFKVADIYRRLTT
jgi:nitric oxide reductase NorD protein